jgi:hypothetical protein
MGVMDNQEWLFRNESEKKRWKKAHANIAEIAGLSEN